MDTQQPAVPPQKTSRKKIWAIVCLTAPTALLILCFILFALINYIFSAMDTGVNSESYGYQAAANVIIFLVGTLGVLTWLPGIIVGITLLAVKPAAPRQ